MDASNHDLAIFLIVLGLRLIVPLGIPRFPLPAIIAALIIDAADQSIFQQFTQLDLDWYQGYDKSLDIFYLVIAYIATMRNWTNLHAFRTSRFLWYYRLVGVALFEALQIRLLLFVFANTFEYFFIFIEGVRTRWNPRRLTKQQVILAAAAIWIFIKLPQEYWIHVAQMDVTDFIREDIFGVPVETSWGTMIADNPVVFAGLGIAIVMVILAIRRFVLPNMPAVDWGWTIDANSHRENDPGWAHAKIRGPVRAPGIRSFFDQAVLEKVVLLAFIVGIFASVIPGVDIGNRNLVIGSIVVVVLNTVITEWLGRHGMSFETAMTEFVGVMIANLAIVVAGYLILGRGSMNVGATMFLLFLVSIIIASFDRYRPYYLRRSAAEAAA